MGSRECSWIHPVLSNIRRLLHDAAQKHPLRCPRMLAWCRKRQQEHCGWIEARPVCTVHCALIKIYIQNIFQKTKNKTLLFYKPLFLHPTNNLSNISKWNIGNKLRHWICGRSFLIVCTTYYVTLFHATRNSMALRDFPPSNLSITQSEIRSRIKNYIWWCGKCHHTVEWNCHYNKVWFFFCTKYLYRTIQYMLHGWSYEVEMLNTTTS